MLTAADRLDNKASGFELGADDYLTNRSSSESSCCVEGALDRRRAHHRPPLCEIAGLRLESVPPRGLPRRPLRRADPEAVRGARSPRRRRRRRRQRRRTPGASIEPRRRPVHRRRPHHRLSAAQTPRRTLGHRHRRWPAFRATASTCNQKAGAREGSVDRAPGLSVRLKLTLSYAGFLMLARVPCCSWSGTSPFFAWCAPRCDLPGAQGPRRPLARFRSDRRHRPGVPARVRSPGRMDSRRPHARPSDAHYRRDTQPPRPDRSPTGSSWKAVRTSPANSPTASTPCSPGTRSARRRTEEIRSGTAEICSQRLPRTAHPAGDRADASRCGPQRSGSRQRRARRPAPHRRRPSDRPAEALLLLGRANNGPSPTNTSTCRSSRKKPLERSCPSQKRHGLTIETSGDPSP